MAVSALVVSGSAMATPVFQATSWNSEIQIYQKGTNNLANADQNHAHQSLTDIDQRGKGNSVQTSQTGDRSLLEVDQRGNHNYTFAVQSGDKSKLLVDQKGNANYVGANQSASSSLINVQQVGNGNFAFASQH